MVELWEEYLKDDGLWVEAYQAKFEGKGKKWGRKEWDALLGHCVMSLHHITHYYEKIPWTNPPRGSIRHARSLIFRGPHHRLPGRKSNPHSPRRRRLLVRIPNQHNLDRARPLQLPQIRPAGAHPEDRAAARSLPHRAVLLQVLYRGGLPHAQQAELLGAQRED
jgi:hypothetical protein